MTTPLEFPNPEDNTPQERIINFIEFGPVELHTGDTIIDLRSDKDLNDLERMAAIRLNGARPYSPMGVYAMKPLATHVRPRGFNGNVRATATVLPIDESILEQVGSRVQRELTPEEILRLEINADFYSFGQELISAVTRQVTYVRRSDKSAKNTDSGTLRILGDADSYNQAQIKAVRRRLGSSLIAHGVIAHAIRDSFQGGTRGQSKRHRT